jgi:hypothetical protein
MKKSDGMEKLQSSVLAKLVGMFRPASDDFLGYPASEVIHGPDDRALVGFPTNFPKAWLMEDFGFTEQESDWLIQEVRKAH